MSVTPPPNAFVLICLRRTLAYGLLSLAAFLFASINVASQTIDWDAECAVDNQGCGPWVEEIDYQLTLASPDCYAYVTYKHRTCTVNGETFEEIVITSWTLPSGCGGWDEKEYFHQTYQGAKEYIILGLLSLKYVNGLESCPQKRKKASVYTAACGIWVCCEYQVTPAEPVCETGYNLPLPHYGTPSKVKVCKWQPCGTVCCRRNYEMCKNELGLTIINLVGKTRLGDCTGQNQYGSKPCEDGC